MIDGIGHIGQRGCRAKRRHSTRGYAEAHMRTLIDGGANAELLNVYQCRRCEVLACGPPPQQPTETLIRNEEPVMAKKVARSEYIEHLKKAGLTYHGSYGSGVTTFRSMAALDRALGVAS